MSAHARITAPIVLATFRKAADLHGYPASTLTDNGMVYTARLAGQGRQGGRTALEAELQRLGITQKNSRPGHPTTCGKAERFQQTLKKWLRAQPVQPTTIAQLQALLDTFGEEYNHRRPHRSLEHRSTPATAYAARPKAAPGSIANTDTHDRVRHDKISKAGTVTLRVAGRLRHLGVGRTYAGTYVTCPPTTSTSASSTPPPANSSASSPSTPARTTSPQADHQAPHRNDQRTYIL